MHRVNPYQYAPIDSRLDGLRVDDIDRRLNHPELHTVYPPLAQLLFAIAYRMSPGRLVGFHVLTLLAELLACLVLATELNRRRLPSFRILLVAWLPLMIIEGYLPGHLDLLGLPLIVLFLRQVDQQRPVAAGISLGLACLIKPLCAVFLPATLREFDRRHGLRFGFGLAATVVLLYLPFSGAGRWLFDSMWRMASVWSFNGSLAALLESVLPRPTAHLILAALLALLVLAGSRWGDDFLSRLLLAQAALIICAPALFPWYLVWLVPVLVLRPDPALLSLCLLSPLAELVQIPYRGEGMWTEAPWIVFAQYLPFYGLLGVGAWRGWGMFRKRAH